MNFKELYEVFLNSEYDYKNYIPERELTTSSNNLYQIFCSLYILAYSEINAKTLSQGEFYIKLHDGINSYCYASSLYKFSRYNKDEFNVIFGINWSLFEFLS